MIPSQLAELVSSGATPEKIDEYIEAHEFPAVSDDFVTFLFRGKADRVDLRHWIYGLPSSIPMARIGNTDLWFQVLQFPDNSRIEYKLGIVQDGKEQWVLDPLNPNVAHDPFGGNSVVHCRGYKLPDWISSETTGSLGELDHLELKSSAFGDTRHVKVYLPHNYRSYRRYRLLIVHDGDDYIRFSSLKHVLDNLIERLEIPPLVVALTNPVKRLREYANDPRHAQHLVEELLPELESRYSLINEPSGRCMMGASFGAVAALSTAWRYPNTFDSLLLQSGSFAFTDIGNHQRSPAFDPVVAFMNEFRKQPGEFAKQVFVSCGVYESLIYENRSLVPFLQANKVKTRFVESRDGHNWENWRDRLRDGLTWLFEGPLWVTYY